MKAVIAMLVLVCLPAVAEDRSLIDRGEYLFQAANCLSCHTDVDNDGEPLAGGRALESKFGTFYSPNITASKTGIGDWSDDDFMRALSEGIAPDGRQYYPSFPYLSYRQMTKEDMLAIKAYVFSRPPIEQLNKNHELAWFLNPFSMSVWARLNDVIGQPVTFDGSRGSYLVDVLGHCNECHTPRNALGMLDMSRKFSGNDELSAPDITSSQHGIGQWKQENLADLFQYGELPDGDYVSDHMAEVVDNSTSRWTPQDLEAAIAYLLGK